MNERNENDKLRVLLLKPGELAEIAEIEDNLESMQRLVEGNIEEYMPFEDASDPRIGDCAIVCNEEGKMLGIMISHEMEVKRGDVFYANLLQDQIGSVQAGIRPVVIKQGDWLNRTSTTYGVALITSQLKNIGMATHVLLPKLKGLPKQAEIGSLSR